MPVKDAEQAENKKEPDVFSYLSAQFSLFRVLPRIPRENYSSPELTLI